MPYIEQDSGSGSGNGLFFSPRVPSNTMGIPHYFRIIAQTYPGIVGLAMPPVDHVFFDFNGAIHQAAKRLIDQKKAAGDTISLHDLYQEEGGGGTGDEGDTESTPIEREIMEAVEVYVRGLAQAVRPAKGIYIYMDGVAPHAKLMQQRKRRYLSMLRYKLLGTEPLWDTNAISPGTMFMVRLGAFLKKRLQEEPLCNGVLTRFSFSDENGEAEHKIFAAMTTIPQGERIAIHGLDADLIMLSLLAHRPNITLMREPQDGADMQYLHIDKLREGILRELATKYEWPVCVGVDGCVDVFGEDACSAIESYVVWCFLLGNDFLPHMPTLHLQKNGLQKVLSASKHTMLVNAGTSVIHWDIMAVILEELSREENDVMNTLVAENVRRRCHAKTDEEKADMWPLLDENKSSLATELYNRRGASAGAGAGGAAGGADGSWRALYYKRLFHTRMHDLSVVHEACREYMTGMEWTYRYYKRLARDPTWYYPYPYAPTMADLANHMSVSREGHIAMVEQWKEKHKVPVFIPDYIQLLCILPPESCHLLPRKLQAVMTDPALGCQHMYPRRYPVMTFLKTRLWECAPVLPPLDIPLLQKSTRSLVTRVERLKPRVRMTEAFSKGFHIAR